MKRYQIERTQNLPIGADTAWQFFSSPLNLSTITPSWLNLKITNELAGRMHPGMVIHYRITPLFGVPVRWISEITHVDPPLCFVDEQLSGPYRFWHHLHRFRSTSIGIEMTDTVSYAMKYGPFGAWLHAWVIERKLADIFDYRQKKLAQIFEPEGRRLGWS
jgi:ligand-binding SRPBCC domain-containing protein